MFYQIVSRYSFNQFKFLIIRLYFEKNFRQTVCSNFRLTRELWRLKCRLKTVLQSRERLSRLFSRKQVTFYGFSVSKLICKPANEFDVFEIENVTFLRILLYFLGNTKATLKQKEKTLDQFKQWCTKQSLTYDEIIKEKNDLKFAVIQYLESYRVKDKKSGNLIRPKKNYLNKIKSMLKTELAQASGKIFFYSSSCYCKFVPISEYFSNDFSKNVFLV